MKISCSMIGDRHSKDSRVALYFSYKESLVGVIVGVIGDEALCVNNCK